MLEELLNGYLLINNTEYNLSNRDQWERVKILDLHRPADEGTYYTSDENNTLLKFVSLYTICSAIIGCWSDIIIS